VRFVFSRAMINGLYLYDAQAHEVYSPGPARWQIWLRRIGLGGLAGPDPLRFASSEHLTWDGLADQVSLGLSFTKSTNHTSRAVIAPAATVGQPPHGTVHA
jgi:hypothetical protein